MNGYFVAAAAIAFVVGLVAFMIGVYAWVAASHAFTPFLVVSVYTRFVVLVAFTAFAVMGLAELAGSIWTHFALRADAALSARSTA
jgi:hypothetical protein